MTASPSVREVLVTGARGKTGSVVVAELAARGIPVRAGSSARYDGGGTVRPVLFDWDQPATWRIAAAGVDSVYLMRPDLADAPARLAEFASLVPEAHVVLLSDQSAPHRPEDSWERGSELAVTEQVPRFTLLRPSWFHQVLIDPRYYVDTIRDDGVLSLPTGGARIAFVDARDIAAVAVASLLDPDGAVGQAYEITGPDALTMQEVADLVSSASGREVVADDPTIEEAVAGMDPWFAGLMIDVFDSVHRGVFAKVSGDVQRVTGRPATSVASFVREYADRWRQPAA